MNRTLLPILILAVALAWWLPQPSTAQNPGVLQTPQFQSLLASLTAQSEKLEANQTAIEEKVAAIEEEIRLARIYAARTGKGGTSK